MRAALMELCPPHYRFSRRQQSPTGCAVTKAAQYREYAEQCKDLAETVDGERKNTLLKIAAAWENCAREADERGEALGE